MSWRTIVITKRAKLDLKTGYLVVRTDNDALRIFLDEISVLIIENPAVAITGCLIAAMNEKKIKVVFCDEKRSPCCELVSYNGSHDSADRIRKQIKWSDDVKAHIWTEIVAEKIHKQSEFLKELTHIEQAELLDNYLKEIEIADTTNREGHAAKVYFNAIFGLGFTRTADCVTNSALNYGYDILLSAFNREIVSHGYLTQLGLFHNNMFNHFNLSCDLMEPFRVLVDRIVYKNSFTSFGSAERYAIVDVLNKNVIINESEQYVSNAIKIYCQSIFDAIEDNDTSKIRFYSLGGNGEL